MIANWPNESSSSAEIGEIAKRFSDNPYPVYAFTGVMGAATGSGEWNEAEGGRNNGSATFRLSRDGGGNWRKYVFLLFPAARRAVTVQRQNSRLRQSRDKHPSCAPLVLSLSLSLSFARSLGLVVLPLGRFIRAPRIFRNVLGQRREGRHFCRGWHRMNLDPFPFSYHERIVRLDRQDEFQSRENLDILTDLACFRMRFLFKNLRDISRPFSVNLI